MGFVKPAATSFALLLGLQQSLNVHGQTCPEVPNYLSGERECLNEGCTASDVKVRGPCNQEVQRSFDAFLYAPNRYKLVYNRARRSGREQGLER